MEEVNITPDPNDVENNKVMAILAYILFLIPLLAAKDSPFAKYHTNQGLVLFLFSMICIFVNIIPILGQIIWIAGSIFSFVCFIMGIINAAGGKMKPLPLIGKITLIK